MPKLGLIGYPLGHSFSPAYFAEKFEREGIIGWEYKAYPLEDIGGFPRLWEDPDLRGLNVTIPHKQTVIPFLDILTPTAADIGAVNTVRRLPDGRLLGDNTDAYGFRLSLENFLAGAEIGGALVLGTGGAARAVTHVLEALDIPYRMVSRRPRTPAHISYAQIDGTLLRNHRLIINTTPLGTHPRTDACPDIPYSLLSPSHFLYDLVYNPAETLFMKKGREHGAHALNGLPMLHLQAERAWLVFSGDGHQY